MECASRRHLVLLSGIKTVSCNWAVWGVTSLCPSPPERSGATRHDLSHTGKVSQTRGEVFKLSIRLEKCFFYLCTTAERGEDWTGKNSVAVSRITRTRNREQNITQVNIISICNRSEGLPDWINDTSQYNDGVRDPELQSNWLSYYNLLYTHSPMSVTQNIVRTRNIPEWMAIMISNERRVRVRSDVAREHVAPPSCPSTARNSVKLRQIVLTSLSLVLNKLCFISLWALQTGTQVRFIWVVLRVILIILLKAN